MGLTLRVVALSGEGQRDSINLSPIPQTSQLTIRSALINQAPRGICLDILVYMGICTSIIGSSRMTRSASPSQREKTWKTLTHLIGSCSA